MFNELCSKSALFQTYSLPDRLSPLPFEEHLDGRNQEEAENIITYTLFLITDNNFIL